MKIKLKPCYPGKPTLAEQLEAVKSEYEEVLEAAEKNDWKETCKELLDLMQTIVGYYDIMSSNWQGHILSKEVSPVPGINLKTLKYFWTYYNDKNFKKKIGITLAELYWIAEINFQKTIKENDRGCKKIRNEIIEQLLDEHYQKLERRKEEWENEK